MTSPYQLVPNCILSPLSEHGCIARSYCAGFEFSEWRCTGLADNLIEWIIDYALKSDELRDTNHTNSFIRLKQAASRVYTTENYQRRGEIGEITAHAICRTYFATIPIAARVNYLSSSNDPVKAFDLVHVRYIENEKIELWLGEAKFFQDRNQAIQDAIRSITGHISAGFLRNEKLLLGPQVSNDIPHSHKIKNLLSAESSLDELIRNAIFPVFIMANSNATSIHTEFCDEYKRLVGEEILKLWTHLSEADFIDKIRVMLIYVPLQDKIRLAREFDNRLKNLQI